MPVMNLRALRAGTAYAALLAGALATPAFAQSAAAPAAQASDAVEEIIVVGSRIQRKDADAVGVVTTITE